MLKTNRFQRASINNCYKRKIIHGNNSIQNRYKNSSSKNFLLNKKKHQQVMPYPVSNCMPNYSQLDNIGYTFTKPLYTCTPYFFVIVVYIRVVLGTSPAVSITIDSIAIFIFWGGRSTRSPCSSAPANVSRTIIHRWWLGRIPNLCVTIRIFILCYHKKEQRRLWWSKRVCFCGIEISHALL